ncbi:beta-ketoacyl synthase [Thalassolituus oleivorans]|uniref:beta-ketoacyl synthase n=1 Tax=Thalassolituus oleivorans TaxID=187493 RepID=UPI0023F5510E|nr:beta-ketoacyl synthase [Thalassolituus oleivorans]
MSTHHEDVVIAGFGGINAAGRSSGHQAFRRVVYDALSPELKQQTLAELATLTSSPANENLLQHSCVRAWDNISWDANAMPFNQPFTDAEGNACFRITSKRSDVQSGGQLPKGFDPSSLYPARHHPRGLQMALYAAADALGCTGITVEDIKHHLSPDQIAVYCGSAAGQLDPEGFGGMLSAAHLGQRNSSRQLPLGMSSMPADFINAYILGNAGATGSSNGACASFLYNLRMGLDDIRSKRRRLVLVGNSEAPILPGIVEGFNAMTALATEQRLRALDELSETETPNYQKASRPFANNAGFSIAESAQCFVLADRELALEMGLTIYGSVGDVFIHADGHKNSISAPGIGNYLSLGKALASAQKSLGEYAVKERSFIHAHGSSTPHNRTTESELLSRCAGAFGIKRWPVCAIKAHIGHSIAAASADQLLMTLGSWETGILPGITTADAIAEDVIQDNLDIRLSHQQERSERLDLAFINSKGFGGNNATGWVLSGRATRENIEQALIRDNQHYLWKVYLDKNEQIKQRQNAYLNAMRVRNLPLPYKDKEQQPHPEELQLNARGLTLPGWDIRVEF